MKYKAAAIVSMYNSKQFIRQKIQNLKKVGGDIQVILIDCTGGEEMKLIDKITTGQRWVKIVYNHRIGLWKAMNRAIRIADAPYVVQSNTDDILHQAAYRKQIAKLDAGYDISYFDYYFVEGYYPTWETGVKKSFDIYRTPNDGYSVGKGLGPFPMWRKSLHDEYGYFDEKLEIFGDALFWDALAKGGARWGRIPEFLGLCSRRAGENLEMNEALSKKDREYLKRKNAARSPALPGLPSIDNHHAEYLGL